MPYAARRPAYSRAAAMLVALLSAVLLGGVLGASCTMHGLCATTGADMASGGDMAHHAGMTGMSHGESPAEGGEHHGCCTCIGDCTMVAPVASAPTAAILLVALVAPEPGRPLDAEPRHPPSVEPDRLLPFANGPPLPALV